LPDAVIEHILHFDSELFLWINGKAANGFFDILCPFMRKASNWIPLYAILIWQMFVKYKRDAFYLLIISAVTILISDQLSGNLIKHAVERLRPCNDPVIGPQVRLLVNCGSGFSFVSSHACNHFAAAMLLGRIFRDQFSWLKLVLLFWAGLISFSQVYVGVHYPIDVFCGAILGVLIGWLSIRFTEKYFPPFKLSKAK